MDLGEIDAYVCSDMPTTCELPVSTPPSNPKIYHITHVDNLSSIVAKGGLMSDRAIVERGGPDQAIGMASIKMRRVALQVACHPGTNVGDYVPFYLCTRSIMLFVIHRGNHPKLTYRGGQGPILHLVADLYTVVRWAAANDVPWAISLSNAGAYYAEFRSSLADLGELDWPAIAATDFRERDVKEHKQAEFLVHDQFPFGLIEQIGVQSRSVARQAVEALRGGDHRPDVSVQPDWYF